VKHNQKKTKKINLQRMPPLLTLMKKKDDKKEKKKKDKKKKDDKKEDDKDKKENKAGALAGAALGAVDPRKYNPLAGSGGSWRSWDPEEKEDNLSECCCCLCVCSNKKTENLTCCLCIPIKAGVTAIGVITFVLAAYWVSV